MPIQLQSAFQARLRQIPAPKGWCACVLDAAYPVAEPLLPLYKTALKQLTTLQAEFDPQHSQEVFLQFDRFRPEDVPLLQANAGQWLPDIGLGFWPDRGAPALWTREEFINSTQDELRPLMHRVFRIQQEKKAIDSAFKVLSGTGVLLCISVAMRQKFYFETMEYYLPQITELSLRSFPFYIPLLDGASLRAASEEDLQNWLCGAAAYMRESSEDGGLLIVVPSSSDHWLDELVKQNGKSEIHWQIESI
jgi:hypothetical protein